VSWVSRRLALTEVLPEAIQQQVRDGKIMKGHVAKDHVPLFVSIPPQVTISRLLQCLKGKTAHHLMAEFTHIKKQFWGRHLWAREYFCCSSGNVTDEVVAKHIAEQNIEQDEDFRVDG